MSNMDNSLNFNINSLITKAHLNSFMGDCLKSNGDIDLTISESLLNNFKEASGISHIILDFFLL
jgi:hypothetical protein